MKLRALCGTLLLAGAVFACGDKKLYPTQNPGGANNNTSQKPKTTTFILAGDSTCAENGESKYPQAGWGQCLAASLGEGAVVKNMAVAGESSRSYIDGGQWAKLCLLITRGSIVCIQFGHNDAYSSHEERRSDIPTYKSNLRKMIKDVRDKNGIPVLLTSVSTRTFDADGAAKRSIGEYPEAMRAVASETQTYLIDINELTFQWLSDLGQEGSVPYYLMDKRDPSAMDNTHLTYDGARVVADMVADGMKELGLWE